ncbi:alpha/beta fold hydrolase [Agrococcus sp. Marseille-P2731]|uniref:alpha/beta fold hydrolase n=1 Tax=Agrococcus sp. Marseille-P2731 TaxID=1841862 RepID=UPI0009F8FAF3|nr:alpha/beta hydrolase [Agrococcus sp. Marseille-P2731]
MIPEPASHDRRTVALPWGDVSYLEWQPGTPPSGSPRPAAGAPTVLLLHGGGLDSALLSWGGIGGELAAAGHRVIAPDHPGYGASTRAPWRASQDRLLGYVAALIDALQLEHYVIGGLSLGGGLAIGHALGHPQRVAGLMLLGSYGLMRTIVPGRLAAPVQLLSWLSTRAGLLALGTRATLRSRALLDASLRPVVRDPAQRTPELLDAILAEGRRGTGIEVFAEWQRAEVGLRTQTTRYSERVGELAMPVLIVHGQHDSGVPLAAARAAADTIPDAQLLVVPEAGHWVQRDRPDVVVPAMQRYLRRLA